MGDSKSPPNELEKKRAEFWDQLGAFRLALVAGPAVLIGFAGLVMFVRDVLGLDILLDLARLVLGWPVIGPLIEIAVVMRFNDPNDIVVNIFVYVVFVLFAQFVATSILFPAYTFRERFHALSYYWAVAFLGKKRIFARATEGKLDVRYGDLKQIKGPGILLVDGVTAVVLEKDEKYLKIVGPGFIALESAARVHATIELRPQSLRREVTVTTREGIEVQIDLNVSVSLNGARSFDGAARFPYDTDAAYHAVYAEQSKTPTAASTAPVLAGADWSGTIAQLAEDILRQLIACYTLDQLFAVDRPDLDPRSEIQESLKQKLILETRQYGDVLQGVSLGNVRPPRAVWKQRVENWCADHEARRKRVEALGQAEHHQHTQAARALAQVEMLGSLVDALGKEGEPSEEILALRLMETLEVMASGRETREQLGRDLPELLQTLERLVQRVTPT